jgi:hypothetical protein
VEQKTLRLLAKYGDSDAHLEYFRGINRRSVFEAMMSLDTSEVWTESDKADLKYVLASVSEYTFKIHQDKTLAQNSTTFNSNFVDDIFEQREKPIFGKLYKTPHNFLSLHANDYILLLNPVLNLSVGQDFSTKETIISNTRGINLRGLLGDKVYFETELLENQENYPKYVDDYISRYNTLPYIGWYKSFKSKVLKSFEGYDFFRATGYIGVNLTKHINMQLGHGSNFIGEGIRSIILSDFSPNYFYLKFNTKFWKIHYQNIYAEVAATAKTDIEKVIDKKYFVNHTFSLNLTNKLRLGLFETVIFNRQNQFELQYLNPMIFYRAIEHTLGSPDNVILGASASYRITNTLNLYSQFVLDEFLLSEVRANKGWWGNKYGIQGGVKYFDAFGTKNLNMIVETNIMRPYTYSHKEGKASFTNYYLPLAHPLGANFSEIIARLNYKVLKKLSLTGQYVQYIHGVDEGKEQQSFGGDVNRDYVNRGSEYGNFIGQGIKKNVRSIQFAANYEVFPNYFIFAQMLLRKDALNKSDETKYINAGIRVNLAQRFTDF